MLQPTGTTAAAVEPAPDWFYATLRAEHLAGDHRPGAYATCPACIVFRARGVGDGEAVSDSEVSHADRPGSVGVSGALAQATLAVPAGSPASLRRSEPGRARAVGEIGARSGRVAPALGSRHAEAPGVTYGTNPRRVDDDYGALRGPYRWHSAGDVK